MECRHGWLTLSLLLLLLLPPPPPLLSSHSIPLRLSLYLYLLLTHRGSSTPTPSTPSPPFPPILSGLIVLHLFIQAFIAASSSCRPISLPDDGFLPQLSRLFIISVDPHHISLTLGGWFSHWTAFTDSPYNKSTEELAQKKKKKTHASLHKKWHKRKKRKPHTTILHSRFTRR